jgi:hypothetical protein
VWDAQRPLSARPATFAGTHGNEREAPIPDLPVLAPGMGRSDPNRKFDPTQLGAKNRSFARRSFDHLVGLGGQHLWHAEAERLGGLEIDDQLELGRLLDREIGRLNHIDAR